MPPNDAFHDSPLGNVVSARIAWILTLAIAGLCFVGALYWVGPFVLYMLYDGPSTDFVTSKSPSRKWQVTVAYHDPWVYGPHDVVVFAQNMERDSTERLSVLSFQISNDGAALADHNCQVTWEKRESTEVAVFETFGHEQKTVVHRLEIETAYNQIRLFGNLKVLLAVIGLCLIAFMIWAIKGQSSGTGADEAIPGGNPSAH